VILSGIDGLLSVAGMDWACVAGCFFNEALWLMLGWTELSESQMLMITDWDGCLFFVSSYA